MRIAKFNNQLQLHSYILGGVALLLGFVIWLPLLHLFFQEPVNSFYQPSGLSIKAKQLAARHLQLWTDPKLRTAELSRMRASNAEWDFMGRSFLVWSLANMGLREPANKTAYLAIMDQIIQETTQLEKEKGIYTFLMPYARDNPFKIQPSHSLFIDGEIALMMGARRMLEEKAGYIAPMHARLDSIEQYWKHNPIMAEESYPDECWTYDHAVALAAFKLADKLDKTDHTALCHAWIANAKQHLIHKPSGLLVSSYRLDGTTLAGPEGSTIWMVIHCLQVVDPQFAAEQYKLARAQMGHIVLGFGYATEWAPTWQGVKNIDAGAVIPVFEVSAGSSGMAFIAASSFHDWKYLQALNTTLDMAAFPIHRQDQLHYAASNQVGDAALLYATVLGPLWEKALHP